MRSLIQTLAILLPVSSLYAGSDEGAARHTGKLCDWFRQEPGTLYKNKENPWIQSFRLGGCMHYQTAWLSGVDEFGYHFSDDYEELRRLRIESKTRFLRCLTASLDINLADDERFLSGASDDLLKEWDDYDLHLGFQGFDESTLEIDLGKATDFDWLKDTSLAFGKMKLETGWERRQSSNEIFTIERSDLSNKLGGEDSRPVGILGRIDRKRWGAELGVFSGSEETDLSGKWNDGVFMLAGASWRPRKNLEFGLQHLQAESAAVEDVLGYASASILEMVYQDDNWGILTDVAYGDNGNEQKDNRQDAFGGLVLMPWYWAVKDRLQLVFRYQFMAAEESEGIRLSSRYLRAGHEEPFVDINKGRGDELHSLYAGANYLLCGDQFKIMAGFTFDRLNAPDGDIYGRTLEIGIRSSF